VRLKMAESNSAAMLKVDTETGLKHSSHCSDSDNCESPSCKRLKRLLAHPATCSVTASGGCLLCCWYWQLLSKHAKQCRDDDCPVADCKRFRPQRKSFGFKSLLSRVKSPLAVKKPDRSGGSGISATTSQEICEEDEEERKDKPRETKSDDYSAEMLDEFELGDDQYIGDLDALRASVSSLDLEHPKRGW